VPALIVAARATAVGAGHKTCTTSRSAAITPATASTHYVGGLAVAVATRAAITQWTRCTAAATVAGSVAAVDDPGSAITTRIFRVADARCRGTTCTARSACSRDAALRETAVRSRAGAALVVLLSQVSPAAAPIWMSTVALGVSAKLVSLEYPAGHRPCVDCMYRPNIGCCRSHDRRRAIQPDCPEGICLYVETVVAAKSSRMIPRLAT